MWLSDGATNILPVPVHRAAKGGLPLTAALASENRSAVHSAWRLHAHHIRHSLIAGFYQGWDLHPAQLPTRYAAVYSFFLGSLDSAAERLRNFIEKAAQATMVGEVFDDAATGQGLLNYFLRAINCGAVTAAEAQELTGLALEDLQLGSFGKFSIRARAQNSLALLTSSEAVEFLPVGATACLARPCNACENVGDSRRRNAIPHSPLNSNDVDKAN